MRKLVGLTGVPAALMPGACNVQLHGTTPAAYTASHDVGMYEVSARLTRDARVTPGSVYVFALGGTRRWKFAWPRRRHGRTARWSSRPITRGFPNGRPRWSFRPNERNARGRRATPRRSSE